MPRYFEFEVSLQVVQPRVWRTFLLRTTSTFAHLHAAIQDSFGWRDYHLWEFRLPTWAGRPIAGLACAEAYDRPTPNGRTVKLNTYFTGKRSVEWCEYLYDFGDDWVHDVKLIAVRSAPESFKRRLLDGDWSGPPEDCGGVPGYQRVVHFRLTGEDLVEDDPEGLDTWLDGWEVEADLEAIKVAFDR